MLELAQAFYIANGYQYVSENVIKLWLILEPIYDKVWAFTIFQKFARFLNGHDLENIFKKSETAET